MGPIGFGKVGFKIFLSIDSAGNSAHHLVHRKRACGDIKFMTVTIRRALNQVMNTGVIII